MLPDDQSGGLPEGQPAPENGAPGNAPPTPRSDHNSFYADSLRETSTVLSNVMTAVLNPSLHVRHLTASELLLMKLTRECINDNCFKLTNIVLQMRVENTDNYYPIVMKIVVDSYVDGNMNWGRLCATMAFVCVFMRHLVGSTQETIDIFAHLLSSFYMNKHLKWLVDVNGLSAGARSHFPISWTWCSCQLLFYRLMLRRSRK
ncbi:apoptosis regulator BALF1 [Common bottlenose dolphin gammaherpesvirus 1 strain Sarasota]|uniref:Apoptosis regulator BALF1 n=1 Tax=Common bottlenose dolphin gammaherpesvirus 1 strain Sarasota TaxID=2022783 RepID=A0A1Z1NED3_9GAMA|nr:apoptosis regulator BALF1 [Common bottlenose dolphin gammaherpesvirus 1 strain Sarasota]ARW78072.1 apoptosis regulator BALF1 [Common bottlenose dolphin gammaherpesvirus 1 strain Sarasota]